MHDWGSLTNCAQTPSCASELPQADCDSTVIEDEQLVPRRRIDSHETDVDGEQMVAMTPSTVVESIEYESGLGVAPIAPFPQPSTGRIGKQYEPTFCPRTTRPTQSCVEVHSESEAHCRQTPREPLAVTVHVFVTALHEFAPHRATSVSRVHATHRPDGSSHTGAPANRAQSASAAHAPHAPVPTSQRASSVASHSEFWVQAWQVWSLGRQVGALVGQWSSVTQTSHCNVVGSQYGREFVHWPVQTDPSTGAWCCVSTHFAANESDASVTMKAIREGGSMVRLVGIGAAEGHRPVARTVAPRDDIRRWTAGTHHPQT